MSDRPPLLPFTTDAGLGEIERSYASSGHRLLIGADEAGRGPLAGPVYTAAVCFDPDRAPLDGLDDSKRLTERRREALFEEICSAALAFAIVAVDVETIDQVNILRASLAGMFQASAEVVRRIAPRAPDAILIDGKQNIPRIDGRHPSQGIIKGDARSYNIAAASILAKVSRDRVMVELDASYPGYGLSGHKGYPTAAHRAAVKKLGATVAHRKSFRGVKEHWSGEVPERLPPEFPLEEVRTCLIRAGGLGG